MVMRELKAPFATEEEHIIVLRAVDRALFAAVRVRFGGNMEKAALLEFGYAFEESREIYGYEFPDIPETLTLRGEQIEPVLKTAGELVRNVPHGIAGGKLEGEVLMGGNFTDEESITIRTMGEAFLEARKLRLPKGELRIAFDDEKNEGVVEVSHPVIPGFSSPPLRRERIEVRHTEINSRGTRGGLYHIERGWIRESFVRSGLEPDPQVTISDNGRSRRIGIGFKQVSR